jgi:succinate dehydrogenase/fumarate reductase flavoprotein subunit
MVTKISNPFDFERSDLVKIAGISAAAMAIPGLVKNAGAASMSTTNEDVVETDVLVIGGGFAGIFAAVKAREAGANVTMVVKGALGRSGMTPWGDEFLVFKALIWGEHKRSKWLEHIQESGEYLTNLDYAGLYIDSSEKVFDTLKDWGAKKSKSPAFREKVASMGINVIERVTMTDLLTEGSRVAGAIGLYYEEDKALVVKAKSVVMATGAGGHRPNGFPLFQLTFDGDAMAYKLGAELTGKEFTDSHGSSEYYPASCWNPRHSVWSNTSSSYGALSLSGAFQAHNQTSSSSGSARPGGGGGQGSEIGGATAGNAGHKTEGIFPADGRCGTSITGLFAAGDALGSMQCGAIYHQPGVSGSGSCAQGWVAGERAAEFAATSDMPVVSAAQIASFKSEMMAAREREDGYSPAWVMQAMQGVMTPYYVYMVKKEDRLLAALANIEFFRAHFVPKLKAEDTHELRLTHDVTHMLQNCEMKLRASLFRTESRGTHYREDYPARDDKNWLAWITLRDNGGKMELAKHPIPDAWKPDMSIPYAKRYSENVFPGETEYVRKMNLS